MPRKISDSEFEIMRILWRENRPLSFAEIRKELEVKTKWNKSTIHTLVTRLKEKDFIRAEEHYVLLYSANISEDDYALTEGKAIIDKMFDGSAKKLVSALYQSGDLRQEDIDELKDFFKMGGTNA